MLVYVVSMQGDIHGVYHSGEAALAYIATKGSYFAQWYDIGCFEVQ